MDWIEINKELERIEENIYTVNESICYGITVDEVMDDIINLIKRVMEEKR